MIKNLIRVIKLSFILLFSIGILTIVSCSSSEKTTENSSDDLTQSISVDPALNNAIDESLANYQSVVIVFYRGYF